MKILIQRVLIVALVGSICPSVCGRPGPFDGRRFVGRIAFSTDGNFNDEDDWAASAVAISMLDAFGVKDKLVHFDFNCILPKTDARFEREHRASVYGAAERFGFPRSVFFDCRRDLDGAVESIKNAINASSQADPLYFIVAGPMEVPCLGIRAAEPAKRRCVYCISHSRWNDGYSSGDLVSFNKRHVIAEGVRWIQVPDQNAELSTSPFGRAARADEWAPWLWMRDSEHENLRWVFSRIEATTRADASDAGMTYFLLSGNERPTLTRLRQLLDERRVPAVLDPRRVVRLEAENFATLESYEVEYGDRQASHRLNVRLSEAAEGRIRTTYDEPYTSAGVYDVAIRVFDGKLGRSSFGLFIDGRQMGANWMIADDDGAWKTHIVEGVVIRLGDPIEIVARGDGDERAEIDYVELHLQGPVAE